MRKPLLILSLIIFSCQYTNNSKNISQLNAEVDSLKIKLSNREEELNQLKSSNIENSFKVINNESFDSFFWNFMTDSIFQIQRVQFPLTYITWKDDIGGEIETIILNKNNWKYNSFYIDSASERTQVYDNFDLKLRPTNQRVIHWYGVETGGDSKYYFEGFDGKWYLIKQEQLGD